MTDYINETFKRGGHLAKARVGGYEVRDGQVALAQHVDAGMHGSRHVLAEAPCGIGKGFAYAVPAIYRAANEGTVTVIATANIALQSQLIEDDLPFLKTALPWRFDAALLKGRGNFACKYKIDQLDQLRMYGAYGNPGTKNFDNYGLNDEQGEQLSALLAWSDVTETGDREEPGWPGGARNLWSKISVGQNECLNAGCRFHDKCFSENHREHAHKANIIVTNYNALYAHLYVLSRTGRHSVLPEFNYLVMDEAHEAARIARDFFGSTLTYARFRRVANFMETEMGASEIAKTLTRSAFKFLVAVGYHTEHLAYKAIGRLEKGGVLDGDEVRAQLKDIHRDLSKLVNNYDMLDGEERKRVYKKVRAAEVMLRNVQQLRDDLKEMLDEPRGDYVYWIELRDKLGMAAAIESRPLDVAPILSDLLFKHVTSATMTSATLTTGGTFNFIRRELGVPENALEVIAPSPFSFSRRSRLVVGSKKLPVPKGANRRLYNESVLPIYRDVLDLWPGRTLCLFTAKTDMEFVHEELAKTVKTEQRSLFKQGEFPRHVLTDWFRQDDTSVLFGVDSFWTGVDVPEPKAIIIHKLPFPRLDIVTRTMQARMGDSFFEERYLPWMIMRLRQGVGRLIRRQNDYGFVVVLDRRGFDGGYASAVRTSLPFGPTWLRTDRLDLVQKFLGRQERELAPAPTPSVQLPQTQEESTNCAPQQRAV